jgi:hypothetical protein
MISFVRLHKRTPRFLCVVHKEFRKMKLEQIKEFIEKLIQGTKDNVIIWTPDEKSHPLNPENYKSTYNGTHLFLEGEGLRAHFHHPTVFTFKSVECKNGEIDKLVSELLDLARIQESPGDKFMSDFIKSF